MLAAAEGTQGRQSSNVYEVNLWLWSFARGKPRLGGLGVEQTFERQHLLCRLAGETSKEHVAENSQRCKTVKT